MQAPRTADNDYHAKSITDRIEDRYELLKTINTALRIVLGGADYVIHQSLNPDEARGVELVVPTDTRIVEFCSVKPQTAAARTPYAPTVPW